LENSPQNVSLSLNEALSLTIKKHNIEIDLYVDSLSIRSEEAIGASVAAPQYNFYRNIGAVQTGVNSSANVIQNLGVEDRQALLSALGTLKEHIPSFQELTEIKRDELREIVEECVQQSTSETTNNTKCLGDRESYRSQGSGRTYTR